MTSEERRLKRDFDHNWHVAINQFNLNSDKFRHWMYEAKTLSQEVSRLKSLFTMEREGKLKKIHKQCSMSQSEEIPENYLKCCLGIKCQECPELIALNKMEKVTPEQIDEAKAWTCAVHIVSKGGDIAGEGYLLTVDDRMFWDNVYKSLSQTDA
ncbi:MAG: hypothetical protein CVU71_03880 [Deltaproteobacteria bacterium HGW-Deltaproteobacteria-6]|jgi:G3E family GTPase|nr:MAG: hypothetical protein CVU71_03880 [Deltaproteobacteria bacterium HGW-Deltaproteobacteria-6]